MSVPPTTFKRPRNDLDDDDENIYSNLVQKYSVQAGSEGLTDEFVGFLFMLEGLRRDEDTPKNDVLKLVLTADKVQRFIPIASKLKATEILIILREWMKKHLSLALLSTFDMHCFEFFLGERWPTEALQLVLYPPVGSNEHNKIEKGDVVYVREGSKKVPPGLAKVEYVEYGEHEEELCVIQRGRFRWAGIPKCWLELRKRLCAAHVELDMLKNETKDFLIFAALEDL